jgi:hypothetical protein
MITKFRIYESNGRKKYFYHATKFEHLPFILKHGLTPNIDRKVNWSGLEEWSRGKVFVTDSLDQAFDYGGLINKKDNSNFPILRILIDPKTLVPDEYGDFYSTEPIRGKFDILIEFGGNWEPLKDWVEHTDKYKIPYTININGVYRSTTNSKGDYIANTEDKIENFYKWFKDSIVIDENKKPLIVYHGTTSNFDKFDIKNTGQNTDSGMWGKGFYFTDKKTIANTYSKRNEKTGTVMSVYLSLNKPYLIKNKSDIFKIDVPAETEDDLLNGAENYSRIFREKLIEKGYDGVIVYDFNNSNGYIEYVAFYPNQIKSAIYNNGEFSRNTSNINEMITKLHIFESKIPETIVIDGVSKSTKNSNNQFIGNTKNEIINFYKWFGDSKVVDENDRPLVVYHGTNIKFNTFKSINRRYFFSDNIKTANSYRSDYVFIDDDEIGIKKHEYDQFKDEVIPNKINIMQVYLKITNPKIKDYKGENWLNSPIERDIDKNKDGTISKVKLI